MTDAMFDEVSRCRQVITRLTRENSILMTQIERMSLSGIHSCHAECQRPVCRLTRERDALLEALKRMASIIDKMGDMPDGFIHPSPWQTLKCEEALTQARAAIKAVEENT